MVSLLLQHRARLDTLTDTGYTPLHLAASGGNSVLTVNTLRTNTKFGLVYGEKGESLKSRLRPHFKPFWGCFGAFLGLFTTLCWWSKSLD